MVIFCAYLFFSFVGTVVVGKGWDAVFNSRIYISRDLEKWGEDNGKD
jgi:hypothetical protein